MLASGAAQAETGGVDGEDNLDEQHERHIAVVARLRLRRNSWPRPAALTQPATIVVRMICEGRSKCGNR